MVLIQSQNFFFFFLHYCYNVLFILEIPGHDLWKLLEEPCVCMCILCWCTGAVL